MTVVFGLSTLAVVSSRYAITKGNTFNQNALYSAEAGVSKTAKKLSDNPSFTGFSDTDSGRGVLYDDSAKGKATYTTQVVSVGSDTYDIRSTGTYYKSSDDTLPSDKKAVAVRIKLQKGGSNISDVVYAGPGGIVISSSVASIGSKYVYTSGKISISGGSPSIGSANKPANVYAGNIGCNVGGIYPSDCPSSSPPISFTGASPAIYGTVCATNQISSDKIYPGNGGEGLKPGCIPPAVPPFTFDKQAHYNSMTSSLAASSASCASRQAASQILKNTAYSGNVSISRCNSNSLVTGNAYINGNLTLSYGNLQVDESAGTTPPVIVVNGLVQIDYSSIVSNSQGTYPIIISFKSSNSACSSSTSCVTLSSADLESSVGTTAFTCTNCQNGNAKIVSYFGQASIGGSSTSTGVLQAQKLYVSGSGITIGSGSYDNAASISQTSSYSVIDYRQLF